MYVTESKNFRVLYSIDSALTADIYCEKQQVDLILMDVITAEGKSGLDAAERIKQKHPHIKIIIVTSMPEVSYLKRAKEIGVDSFWYKEFSQIPILEVMERTMEGKHIYPDTTPVLKLGIAKTTDFTERELEVLREITTGNSNAEISENLHISEATVKTHLSHMLQKTGYKTRTELAVKARVSGLVISDKEKIEE